jgi:hypothetical protein
MANEGAKTHTVTIKDRDFFISEPDTPLLIRALKVLAAIEERQPEALTGLAGLFGDDAEDLEERATGQIFKLIAALEEEDLYRLGTALLQMRDERAGMAWLQENGLPLSVLVEAVFMNVEQAQGVFEDLTAVIRNFTPGLAALLNVTPEAEAAED